MLEVIEIEIGATRGVMDQKVSREGRGQRQSTESIPHKMVWFLFHKSGFTTLEILAELIMQ
jgi:hypothetical protein